MALHSTQKDRAKKKKLEFNQLFLFVTDPDDSGSLVFTTDLQAN